METLPEKKFPLSYEELAQSSAGMSHCYDQHWTHFHEKYPDDFAEDLHIIFREMVVEMRTHYSDDQMLKAMSTKTEALDKEFDDFYYWMMEIHYYAKKAYGEKSPNCDRLNIGKVGTIKNNRKTYLTKTDNYHHFLHECSADLLAVGMPESFLKSLDESKKKIDLDQWDRVKAKYERTDEAVGRITAGNNIWDMMVKISEAAERVFFGKPEIIALFVLPRRKTKKRVDTGTIKPDTPSTKS